MTIPFQHLQFDTSNVCNLKCKHCLPQMSNTPRKQMPLHTIEHIMNMAGSRRLQSIRPFLYGDPLLEKRFHEITRIIWKYNHSPIAIYTNGVAYENREFLTDEHLNEVHFTVNAATSQVFRQVCTHNKLSQALRTIEWFRTHRRSSQCIHIHFVQVDANRHELEEWKNLWKKLDAELVVSEIVYNYTNRDLISRVCDLSKPQPTGMLRDTMGIMPCLLWSTLAIDVFGRYTQCCTFYDVDKLNYGSVYDLTLDEAWRKRCEAGLENKLCLSCNMLHPDWRSRLGDLKMKAEILDQRPDRKNGTKQP